VLTDPLLVGDASSESAHAYDLDTLNWTGTRTYTYEYEGNFSTQVASRTGRAHVGYSEFTMMLQPTNAGAILRRQFDQGILNQQVKVSVDGVLVGPWYVAGGNPWHRWRDDDFLIPAVYVNGKSTVRIRIDFVSSSIDWNEFAYSFYTIKPPPTSAVSSPSE
jgi:hypothetical protein